MDFFSFSPPHNLTDNYYKCLWDISVHSFAYYYGLIYVCFVAFACVAACAVGIMGALFGGSGSSSSSPKSKYTRSGGSGLFSCILLLIGNVKLIWWLYIPIFLYKGFAVIFGVIGTLVTLCAALVLLGIPGCKYTSLKLNQVKGRLSGSSPEDGDNAADVEDVEDSTTIFGIPGLLALLVVPLYAFITFACFYFFCVFVRAAQYVWLLDQQNGN
ncbi:hypothetical protein M3Y97_00944100 [Aphelenchoides bicaudatus]|nr:hypothetical protein M3Y97_00944100 [Aphelenchoides bicaudatus]